MAGTPPLSTAPAPMSNLGHCQGSSGSHSRSGTCASPSMSTQLLLLLLWGLLAAVPQDFSLCAGAWPAPDACFQDVNMAGNTYGNCGKDSQGRYVKCDKRWVQPPCDPSHSHSCPCHGTGSAPASRQPWFVPEGATRSLLGSVPVALGCWPW